MKKAKYFVCSSLILFLFLAFLFIIVNKNVDKNNIVLDKFGISISSNMKVVYLDNSKQSDPYSHVIIELPDEEYKNFHSQLLELEYKEADYSSNISYSAILKNNHGWISTDANITKVYKNFENKKKVLIPFVLYKSKQVSKYIFVSDTSYGYKKIYLINYGE